MVVNGRKEVQPGEEVDELHQLRLRHRLTAHTAEAYVKEGFTVIVQDIVIGRLLVDDFIPYIHHRPFHVVALCPDPKVVEQREAQRQKKGYGIWTVDELDRIFRTETPNIGLWLDSSDLTAEETAAEILSLLENDAGIQ